MRSTPLTLAFVLTSGLGLLAGCDTEPPVDVEDVQRLDLRAALGQADVEIVGVTIEPETGRRFVLDATLGIFELEADGATLVLALADFPIPDIAPVSEYTDFVAMGEGRFAVTARNNGYLLDLGAHSLSEYFCYVPELLPDPVEQLTKSLTYDPSTETLFAQPVTYQPDAPDTAVGSSIGGYAQTGGQPIAWFEVPETDFLAGGAAIDADGSLLLGRDDELYRFVLEDGGQLERVGRLARIERIEAMAVDAAQDTVLIVDGAKDQLFELRIIDDNT